MARLGRYFLPEQPLHVIQGRKADRDGVGRIGAEGGNPPFQSEQKVEQMCCPGFRCQTIVARSYRAGASPARQRAGVVYSARISLNHTEMQIEDKIVLLSLCLSFDAWPNGQQL